MDDDHVTALAVAPEQGGGTAEELTYRLQQQQLTAEFGRYALKTHDVTALLQEATRICALGLNSKHCIPDLWLQSNPPLAAQQRTDLFDHKP